MILCSLERIKEKITAFSYFGKTEGGGITRRSLSPAALAARAEIKRRMEKIGLTVKTDDLADMYCTLPGTESGASAIYSGSHCDSVMQGGNYDGILGVIAAMEAVETIVTEKIPHRHPITVCVWTNEEGDRFLPAIMCTGIICNKFKKEDMLASEAVDIPGYTFGKALDESGYKGSEENRIDPKKTKALIELHIEQGPVLENANKDIGVVEGVCGMINYDFTFTGRADHAGTFPMALRKDAFYAACKVLEYIHTEFDRLDSKLVYTTGQISCHPNIHTIVPDTFTFSLDARHSDPEVIKQCVEIIRRTPEIVEGCEVSYCNAWNRDTVKFNKMLVNEVEQSANELGYSSMRMYSGAGHDSQYLCEIVPTTMIFVPSKGGHSHCEDECTAPENCWKGANVLLRTILAADK